MEGVNLRFDEKEIGYLFFSIWDLLIKECEDLKGQGLIQVEKIRSICELLEKINNAREDLE